MLKLFKKAIALSLALLFGLYSTIAPLSITVNAGPAQLDMEVDKNHPDVDISFVQNYTWDLSKTAVPDSLELPIGSSGDVTYTVTATKTTNLKFTVKYHVEVEYPVGSYSEDAKFRLETIITHPSGSPVFVPTTVIEPSVTLVEGGLPFNKTYTTTLEVSGPDAVELLTTPPLVLKVQVTLVPISGTDEITKSAAIPFNNTPTATTNGILNVFDSVYNNPDNDPYDWQFTDTSSVSYTVPFSAGSSVGSATYPNTVTGTANNGGIATPATEVVTINTIKATGDALSINGYTGVYDSNGHGVTVNNSIAGDTLYYSLDNSTWSTTMPMITDVTSGTIIYVKAENASYNDRIGSAMIVITARPITIKADDDSKDYDGIALTANGYTLTSGTLAAGETIDGVTVTGSQTNVGSSANIASAAIILDGSTNVAPNYAITYQPGTLTVTKGTGTTLVIDNYNDVYDSAAHTIILHSLLDDDVVYYSLTNNGSDWTTIRPTFTNVTPITTVHVKVINPNYEDRLGSGTVTITVRPITIKANDASKVFDGSALTNNSYSLILGTLASGETFFSVTVVGSQTNVGSSANTASAAVIKDGGFDVSSNYEVTYATGTLTVTKATGEVLNIIDYNEIYDSEAHSISIINIEEGDVVYYSLNGIDWSLTKPFYTNVTSTRTVYVKVSNDNYNDRTGSGTITITARPITIKADDNTKAYDGTPLTDNGYSLTLGSLADGETFYLVTVTGSQTNVGSSANIASEAVIFDGLSESAFNYAITYLPGTLTVTKGIGTTLNIDNYTEVYDSNAHSINITNLVFGDEVYYSLTNDGTDWTMTQPMFTDVTAITMVYVRIVNPNYEDRLGSGSVTITLRPITIKANDGTKMFDGTPLTNNSYTLTLGSLASGDTFYIVSVVGTQTNVGASDNVASNAIIHDGEDDVSSNYDVTYVDGILTVTKAIGQVLNITNYSGVYDSEEHGITLNNPITGDTVYYSLNGIDWSTINPMETNVTAGTTVYVNVVNDDYEDRTGSGTITITARPITIKAYDDSKVFDGNPLTNNGYSLILSTLASGESISSVVVTGSQTNVGSSANVASAAVILDGAVDVSTNYQVTYENGVLSVTPATGEELDITDYDEIYDSEAHSISIINLIGGDVVYYSLTNDPDDWSMTKPMFTNVTPITMVYVKVVNPNYINRVAGGSVTIDLRPISIKAIDDSKVFDGAPLINTGYQLVAGTLAGTETVFGVTVTGSQTIVGSSANVASSAVIHDGDTDVSANYQVTYVDGLLSVTPATGEELDVDDFNGVYDSAEHSILIDNQVDGDVVYFSLTNNGIDWSLTQPMFTNVSSNTVYVKVVNPNYLDRLGNGSVNITLRPITIKANDGTKVFDGSPLTNNGYTLTVGTLASGESFFSVTVTGSQTIVGSSANVASAAILHDGDTDVSSNYEVTYVNGLLSVTKATGQTLDISDYNEIYDSEAHSISVINAGLDDVVYYSLNGIDWSLSKPIYTNVTSAVTVFVKVSNDNYEDRLGSGSVTITLRPITIKANDDTKVFDGSPLNNIGYSLTLGTLADEESFFNVTITGSQTIVGSSANVASSAVIHDGDTDVSANYQVTYVDGLLSVTPATGEELDVDDFNGVYDSAEHSILIDNQVDGDVVYFSLTNNGIDWSLTQPMFTNVSSNTIYVKVVNPNYLDRLGNGSVNITLRPITIKANDGTKVFDGSPLTNNGYTLTVGTLASGESLFSVTVTGSQTIVGSSANVASAAILHDGDTDVSANYEVTYVNGLLSVTSASGEELDVIGFDGVYDSAEHSILIDNQVDGDVVYFSLTNNGIDWSLTQPMFTNVSSNTVYVKVVNPNYLDRLGNGSVNITLRPITITAGSGSKVADGTPLTNSIFTLSLGSLADGETLSAVTLTGSQTLVGSSANIASGAVILDGIVNVASNYAITYTAGTLTITAAPVPTNTAPTAAGATYTIQIGSVFTRAFIRGDVDGDPLTISVVNGPDRGAVLVVGGQFTYTHNGVTLDSDFFTFRVYDGEAYSPIRTIRINFTALPFVNTAPEVIDADFETDFETALNETVGDLGSDFDNDPLTFAIVTQPEHGTVTFNADGTFRYVPENDYDGNDSFTYKANDGTDDSNVSTVTITVGEEIIIIPEPTPEAPLPWWWLLGLLPFLLFLIRRPRPEVQDVALNPDGTITTTWGYLGSRLMHKDYDRDESVLEVVSGDVKVMPPVDSVPYEFDRGRHENSFKTVSDKNAVIRWTIKKKSEVLDNELIEKMLKKNQK